MKIQIPVKFQHLINTRAPYKVNYGGRGGAKSRSYGGSLIHLSNKVPLRILCTREIQKSIKHSSKKLLEDEITRQGLYHQFKITDYSIVNKITKSEFIFEGLWRNIDSIKSIEGIDITWAEEGHTLSQNSIDIAFPSVLRKKNSEIWISYNPRLDEDPVHQMFVLNTPPPGSIVQKVNHYDNPWFPDELRQQMEWCQETDLDKYNHIWLGETLKNSEENVYHNKWFIEKIPEPPEGTQFFHGLDWGFSADPMAGLRCWEDGDNLMIDYEVGGHGVENDDIVRLVESKIETFRDWPSYADNSRPETISHVKGKGFLKIKPCDKWKGSVEDGISYIRSYKKIIVDPRCVEVIKEFGLYKYKTDKLTHEILPLIIDKNNHWMDALRYALNERIKHTHKMVISKQAVQSARQRAHRRR